MAHEYRFEIDEWGDEDYVEDPYKYVLGQDPGGTTGVALLRYTDDTQAELIYLHQIPDGIEGYYEFFEDSYPESNLTIVSEKWVERNVKGADRTPQYIEGMQYAWWSQSLKRDPEPGLVYQEPDVKSLVPDEWLKENNLWTPGKRHQMDALIHAIVYLRNKGHKPTLEALSGKPTEPMEQEGGAKSKELGEAAQSAADALAEAMKQFAEAMDVFAEALQEAENGGEPGDGKNKAPARRGDEDFDNPDVKGNASGHTNEEQGTGEYTGKVKITGGTKRRERNGIFVGYDIEGEEKVLYSD